MAPENTLLYLAHYIGRILLLCFSQWMLEHPHVTENQGALFAENITLFINDYFSSEENYKKIGLEEYIPLNTLVTAFFYSDPTSHYFQARDLGANFTFRELFDRKEQESGIDCAVNHRLCEIEGYLEGNNRRDYVYDFRLSEKIFEYQYYSKENIIPRNVWYTDYNLDRTGEHSGSPGRTFNYPTKGMFYRCLIDKNLEVKELGLPLFGVHRNVSAQNDYNYDNSFFIDTYKVPGTTYYRGMLQNSMVKDVVNFMEGYMVFPGVPWKSTDYDLLIYLAERHLNFYPYTSQPFNVTDLVLFQDREEGEVKVDVSDRYYRMEEEDTLGGFNKTYNKVWVFSNYSHDAPIKNVVNNLTSFIKCMEEELFGYCTEKYIPWYDDCYNEDNYINKMMCNHLKDNLKLLGLYRETTEEDSDKNKEEVNALIIGLVSVIVGVLIIVIVVNFKFKKWFRKTTEEKEEEKMINEGMSLAEIYDSV